MFEHYSQDKIYSILSLFLYFYVVLFLFQVGAPMFESSTMLFYIETAVGFADI